MCHPQELSLHHEAEGALLHVQHDQELVGHQEGLVRGQGPGVGLPGLVLAVQITGYKVGTDESQDIFTVGYFQVWVSCELNSRSDQYLRRF